MVKPEDDSNEDTESKGESRNVIYTEDSDVEVIESEDKLCKKPKSAHEVYVVVKPEDDSNEIPNQKVKVVM